MSLRSRLALVLAAALLVPACGNGVTTPTDARAAITVSVDPTPVPGSQNVLTGAISVGYKVVITETNGGSGEVQFVSSQIFNPATGQQVALTYFDSADLIVFVGSNKIEPKGTLTVPQTASYILPDLSKAAQLTVSVQVKDTHGSLLNQSVLVNIQ
jgi:hypothetical protein